MCAGLLHSRFIGDEQRLDDGIGADLSVLNVSFAIDCFAENQGLKC
jgi:hypothetical protein